MRHADKSTDRHHPRVERRPTVDEPARILRNLTSLPDAEFASTYSPTIAAAFASYRDLPDPAAANRALLLALKAALKRRRAFILPRFTQAEDSWRIRECASYAVAITIIVEHAAAMHRVDHPDPPPHPDVWARLLADLETDATETAPTTRTALFHSLVPARDRRWIAREPLVRTLIANYFTGTEPNELHEIVDPVVAGFGLDGNDPARPQDDNPQLTQAAVPGPSSKPSSRKRATLLLRIVETGRAVFGRLRRERRLAHEADGHRDAAQTAAAFSRKLNLQDAARRSLATALEPLATDLSGHGAHLAQLDVPTATRYLAAKRAEFERNLAAERNAIETILPHDRRQPTHPVSVPGPEHGDASPPSGSADAHPDEPDPATTVSLEDAPATAATPGHADIPAISPPPPSPTTAQQSLALQAPLSNPERRGRDTPLPTTKEPDTRLHRTPKPNRTRRSRSCVVDILDDLPATPPPDQTDLPLSPVSHQGRRPAIGDHSAATARIGHGANYARSLMAENGVRLTEQSKRFQLPGPVAAATTGQPLDIDKLFPTRADAARIEPEAIADWTAFRNHLVNALRSGDLSANGDRSLVHLLEVGAFLVWPQIALPFTDKHRIAPSAIKAAMRAARVLAVNRADRNDDKHAFPALTGDPTVVCHGLVTLPDYLWANASLRPNAVSRFVRPPAIYGQRYRRPH